jgi:DNA gyrase subunit B
MTAEVCRGGGLYAQSYKQGKPVSAVKKTGTCKQTGTIITFEPDPEIFKEIVFDRKKLLNHLRQQAYLTKGVRIDFYDLRDEKNTFDYHFYFEGGVKSYLRHLTKNADSLHNNAFYGTGEKKILLLKQLLFIPTITKYMKKVLLIYFYIRRRNALNGF